MEKHRLHPVTVRDSRAMFETLGIHGEVIVTDYHSPDSITFLSDEREAVIGDLPPAIQEMPGDEPYDGLGDRCGTGACDASSRLTRRSSTSTSAAG